ncbi:OmpA family protein [Antarcticimicrobium sediminis]|uniref:OmpA family protein n=1 Tax=Antarcticimicrobium sediminis TaxID=2546227 RepID=A0A4R5EVM6_9RHOB|nr:OmpA family protein [Antarcticimicrobium sediminis]TDE38995.1 OmpA family protein [Antarcticimicrobium sediminis]
MKLVKLTTVTAISTVFLLAACTDPARVDSGDPYQKTKQGALIGGLLGAGIGAVSGSPHKTTAVLGGATLGAIVGAGIGESLDRQEAELRNALSSDGITITNTGDRLIVSLPNDITFATDSFAVRPGLRADVNRVAAHLQRYPDMTVQVIGHTDSDGDAAYNIGLSKRRANAVADILQAGGVSYTRLAIVGRGEEVPVASNLTEEGKARNRRVEIVMIPTK